MAKAKKTTKKPAKEPEEDLLAQLQRLQAEFDNFKRRTENEHENARKYTCGDVIASLLPIIDNYELALNNATNKKDSFYKGMELIYAQLQELLTFHGVTEITTTHFDPAKHEAMLAEEGKEKGIILEVLQKGYELDGRVLRTAKVKVTR